MINLYQADYPFNRNNFIDFSLSFWSCFDISLAVLVYYRIDTNIEAWMKSITLIHTRVLTSTTLSSH